MQKKKAIGTDFEKVQMLTQKTDFKAAILNMLKQLKESTFKEGKYDENASENTESQ